jgi:CheY-like chemotaxis protein
MSVTISDGPRAVVLVVDDSEDQLGLMRTLLERAGCDVILAGTAEDGITMAKSHAPNVAVVDLLLPGMNGWELAERLRAEVPQCAIAVSSVLEAKEYPAADASLPKPVTGAQVRTMLGQLIPGWSTR